MFLLREEKMRFYDTDCHTFSQAIKKYLKLSDDALPHCLLHSICCHEWQIKFIIWWFNKYIKLLISEDVKKSFEK